MVEKKKGAKMASAATFFVDPITYDEMYERTNLPSNTILREDDVTWDMWLPTTDLTPVGNAHLYPCKIVNKGNEVRVIINGYDVGALDTRCLPDAVEALSAHDGQEAPAYLHASGRGKNDTLYVVKPPQHR
jgi:hypothetical protein